MLKCIRCNYEWFERSATPPKRCPNPPCRSMLWAAKEETKEDKLDFIRSFILKPKEQEVVQTQKEELDDVKYDYGTDI